MWGYHIPNQYFLDYFLHEGEVPLWNPLVFCGEPFAAHPLSMLYYPPNLLRSLLVRTPSPLAAQFSLLWMGLAHHALAGIGLFWLARRHDATRLGALVAASTVLLSARFVSFSFENSSFVLAASWVPFVLASINQAHFAASSKARRTWLVGAGLLLGMQLLTGFSQLCLYSLVLYGVYAIGLACLGDRAHTPLPRGVARAVTGLVVLTVIGAGVASVLLVPAAELLRHSDRYHSAFSTYARGVLVDFQFAQVLFGKVREAEGNPFELLRGLGHALSWLLAAHTGCLLLAIAALRHTRRREVALFAVLSYVIVDLNLGLPMPLATIFKYVTPFSIGSSSHGSLLCSTPISILAGLGADTLLKSTRRYPLPTYLSWALPCLGFVAIVALSHPPVVAQAGVRVVFSAYVALGCIILLTLTLPASTRTHYVAGVLVLICLQAVLWNRAYVRAAFDHDSILHTETPTSMPRERPFPTDNRRVVTPVPNRHVCRLEAAANGYNPAHLKWIIRMMANPEEQHIYRRGLWGKHVQRNLHIPLFLKRPLWLSKTYAVTPLPSLPDLFPPSLVTLLPAAPRLPVPRTQLKDIPRSSISAPGQRIVLWDEDRPSLAKQNSANHAVLRFSVPQAEFPGQHAALFVRYSSLAPAEITLSANQGSKRGRVVRGPYEMAPTKGASATMEVPLPDLPPASLNILVRWSESDPDARIHELYIVPDLGDEDALIRVTSRSANSLNLQVGPLSEPRVLAFIDAYYPGWQAFLDGRPTTIHLANDAFKAVVVPPGTHSVTFVFRPSRIRLGMAVSALALLGVCAVLIWSALDRRPRRALPPSPPS